jgi:sugar/nucleoside kinase (ribokinase family)
MDLVIIGVINIHTIMRTRLKADITNPVSEYTEKFSGSALHIAVNASLLGAKVGIISSVGRDAVGLMDVLRRYSIDYSHIVLSAEKNANFIELNTSNRHYTLYYQGAATDLHTEKIEPEYLKKAKIIHICFPDQKLTKHIVNLAKKEDILTSVDATFSEADADIVFTERKKGGKGKTTIVTDFKKGILCNGKEVPVFRDDTYYEEGVKDAFIAAFLTRYMKSEHLENAALYGSCAAYLCSHDDRKVLTCTKDEVDELFDQKKKL